MTEANAETLPTAPAPGAGQLPPATDGQGTGATVIDPQKVAELHRTAADATAQHSAESPKRRGKDKNPGARPSRRTVQVDFVGNSPGAPPVETAPANDIQGNRLDDQPPVESSFDRKTAAALIDVALRVMNDGAAAVIRAIAFKETGDVELATLAAIEARMTKELQATVREGALLCAEKYAIQTRFGPEVMLFGGLCAWSLPLGMQAKALRGKGAERRKQSLDQKRAA